jgi:hypothetical protein
LADSALGVLDALAGLGGDGEAQFRAARGTNDPRRLVDQGEAQGL